MQPKTLAFLSLIVVLAFAITSCLNKDNKITITEEVYNNTAHFKIATNKATYYLEKQNGGFSSIIDQQGTDWVQFHKSDTTIQGAAGAAADYRGLPNMVFQGEQNGVGHPGFDQCVSEKVNDNTIRVSSHSGSYQFTYSFTHEHVVMDIQKADTTRKYWVLYEGPIAGKFNPSSHICITSEGYHPEQPSIFDDPPIMGNFEWMCFGDEQYDIMFYVQHLTPDTLIDIIHYMGSSGPALGNDAPDGMVVMGFGRDPYTNPQMKQFPNSFKFGFMDKPDAPKEDFKTIIGKRL
jgi:hypothetical protein